LFETVTYVSALLTSSFLFGGMLLFSVSFAAFLFKSLPPAEASALIRKAFPSFYIFVIITSLVAALLALASSVFSASILVLIALSTIPTRQILMPAINAATDAKLKRRFFVLHGLSVVITLGHIVAVAFVIVDLATH
jgi:predicted membrane channel-forming protein YqfA (hemolysin III family)